MPRKAEERAADDALRTAIWNRIGLMKGDNDESAQASGMLTKFAVIAVQVQVDDEGDLTDAYTLLYSDSNVLGFEARGMADIFSDIVGGNGFRSTTYREDG